MINTSVSVNEFRSNLATILGRVMYGKDKIIIKKYNRDAAVLLSVKDYEEIIDPTKRLSKSQWKKAVQNLDAIREKIPDIDPKILEKAINQAIKEVRKQKGNNA